MGQHKSSCTHGGSQREAEEVQTRGERRRNPHKHDDDADRSRVDTEGGQNRERELIKNKQLTQQTAEKVEQYEKLIKEAIVEHDSFRMATGAPPVMVDQIKLKVKILQELDKVIIDKTEGSSALKIKGSKGNGVRAYMKLFKWFMQASGTMILEEVK